jgi:hypothetical protein
MVRNGALGGYTRPRERWSERLWVCRQSKGKPSLGRDFHRFRLTPQTVKIVETAAMLGENMDDQVRIVAQYPLAALAPFNAAGPLSDLFELQRDLVSYRLKLSGVAAVADQEEVRESSYIPKI